MKYYGLITAVIVSLFFISVGCKLSRNELEEKEQTVELEHITWACDCADWAKPEDINKIKNGDSLASASIYLEPATPDLALPGTLGYNGDVIKFTGRFYKKKGFPKGYTSIEMPDAARVFRYTKYKVIKSHHSGYKK